MSDIFISYSHQDRDRARELASRLIREGWSVFWDRVTPVGKTWDEILERELKETKAIVVLWSGHSVASEWVRAEAAEAASRNILVPATLEMVTIPIRFRLLQTADLSDWKSGEPDTEGIRSLLEAVKNIGNLKSLQEEKEEVLSGEINAHGKRGAEDKIERQFNSQTNDEQGKEKGKAEPVRKKTFHELITDPKFFIPVLAVVILLTIIFIIAVNDDKSKDPVTRKPGGSGLINESGKISLVTEISGELFLNGKKLAEIDAGTRNYFFPDIPAGPHLVEIKGTQNWKQTITVHENQTTELFAGKEPEPQQTNVTPETLSRTPHSLPGDAILHFRVAEVQGLTMAFEVDYRYNEQHGQKVMVGAKLNGIGSGYKITYVPSHLQGTVLLQMRVEKPGNSEEIEIFLYEHGRPAESFARRVFPFQMRFE